VADQEALLLGHLYHLAQQVHQAQAAVVVAVVVYRRAEQVDLV
jgi:hypothetical protein